MRHILTAFIVAVLSCGISDAIGLGVSPPSLELEEGLGRLTLFNPGDQPINFDIELDGEMAARPSEGMIAPKQTASVIITGNGEGAARILADSAGNKGGIAMPAISVPIKGSEWAPPDETSVLIPALIGATGAVLIAIISLVVILASNRTKNDTIAPIHNTNITENPVIHEERLSETN